MGAELEREYECQHTEGARVTEKRRRYRAYLLRLWCPGGASESLEQAAGWRASLQTPGEASRQGFASLGDLFAYLWRQTEGEPGDLSQGEEQ